MLVLFTIKIHESINVLKLFIVKIHGSINKKENISQLES